MSDEVLELYVKQYIEAQDVPAVNFAWQGGEPTLLGVDFYRRAVELQKRYANGKKITNAFQTNGILLDDEWGEFLAQEEFLIGLSIDGPREMHDRYRVDKGQKPTFDRVMAGLEVLEKHKVEFNTLTVPAEPQRRPPPRPYTAFSRRSAAGFMQFIPIVERAAEAADRRRADPDRPGLRGPRAGDEMVGRLGAVRQVPVRGVRRVGCARTSGGPSCRYSTCRSAPGSARTPAFCIFAETCGNALIIEHNGDLYSCDHFVYPEYNLGNVRDYSIREMVAGAQQRKFADRQAGHPAALLPRVRLPLRLQRRLPQAPLHADPGRRAGPQLPVQGGTRSTSPTWRRTWSSWRGSCSGAGPPPTSWEWVRERDRRKEAAAVRPPGRNDPCPCGSGRKHKRCCGA